jgi:formylglycine-generating enzyme required for sulfatase activity
MRMNLQIVFVVLAVFALLTGLLVSCGDDDDDDNDDAVDDDDSAGDDDSGDDDDDIADDDDDDDDDDTVDVPQFVTVPAGEFDMGSQGGEIGRYVNEVYHNVILTKGFKIMRHELTQTQFADLMGFNLSKNTGDPDKLPVEKISWYDAAAYANKLSQLTKSTPCFDFLDIVCDDDTDGDTTDFCKDHGGIKDAVVSLNGVSSIYDCTGYRFLTEAEWEFAARGGQTTSYNNGEDSEVMVDECQTPYQLEAISWYCANSGFTTHNVGEKLANDVNIYDVHGNVSEWTWDWYELPSGDAIDPEGPIGGTERSMRGGSHDSGAYSVRSAVRSKIDPGDRHQWLGTRLAQSVQ